MNRLTDEAVRALRAKHGWAKETIRKIEEKLLAAQVQAPREPYITIYEWVTPHGTHRSLQPGNWHGWEYTRAVTLYEATQQAVQAGWKQIGWACGEGDCGRIHDEPSTDDDYTQPVYVLATPPAPGQVEPSLEADGPQFDDFFRCRIDSLADKHPTLIVRQLARRLREAWKAPGQVERDREDAENWRWLTEDCDGDAQDDFIRWLSGNVASKADIDARVKAVRAARSSEGDAT